MKTLLIMRHAKSSWKEEEMDDHDRPLNKRGRETAPRMGELICKEKMVPDLIISSTATRARHTAELAAAECAYTGEIRLVKELYTDGTEAFIEALAQVDDQHQRVMVVGHNPTLEELIQRLTYQVQPMPTAALARVELPIERWSELTTRTHGRLAGLWRPKELD